MEQNKLESVHTIVCDAIAGYIPDWKERSRISYEIAFMLKKYMTQHDCTIGISNNQLTFFNNLDLNESFFVTEQKAWDREHDILEKLKKLI
jgi:hypothetical protein